MARTGRVSDAIAALWLADLAARSDYLALMVSDPFLVVDPLTVEVGGAYTRVAVSWLTASRLLRNDGALAWAGIPAGTDVVGVAGFDLAFNGEMSFYAPIPVTSFPAGGGLLLADQTLYVGMDA